MTHLLVQNSKISKSSGGKFLVFNFGIPAYQSVTGLRTCPAAGKCATGCYATQGSYVWPVVGKAYEYRLAQTLRDDFVDVMSLTVAAKQRTAERKKQKLAIRIHDSGDFYNIRYTAKWFEIIRRNPDVQFYAYTKQVAMFKRFADTVPPNLTLIFSEGGTLDQLIGQGDRHSRVFGSHAELVAAGYSDATENDTVAFTSKSGKIGLVYHGYKSTKWTTNKAA